MPAISESNLLQSLGWALINSLWQMALLWVVYQLINSFTPSMKPGKRVNLATGFLVFGFGWFSFTFFQAFFSDALYNPANYIATTLINQETLIGWTNKILPIASLVYFLLLVIPLWQFTRNYHFVQLIRMKGLLKIDAEWRMFVNRLSANMGITRKVHVWVSSMVQSPVTIGYLKPIILIPIAAINNLSTPQVEAILLHELSHIRRYDYLFNLIINIIRTVLYFNPFVRAFVRIIEREREISCDQMVIQFQYQPHEYATALLLLERTPVRSTQMMLAATGNNNLLKRVEAILGINTKDKFSARRLAGAIAVLVCMISMNAVLFINAQKDSHGFPGFVQGHNPYYFLVGDDNERQPEQTPTRSIVTGKIRSVINHPTGTMTEAAFIEPDMGEVVHPPYFYNVSNFEVVIPALAAEDEAKLKGTLQATRKILEDKEWKEVESNYAELLSSKEKSILKDHYRSEVNDFDWNKLETQLRLTYDQLDWSRIDEQVNTSLAVIKLDSFKTIITKSLTDLNKLECWMKENNTTAIPDTDITLLSLKENQQKAREQLTRVKAIRTKKIVRL